MAGACCRVMCYDESHHHGLHQGDSDQDIGSMFREVQYSKAGYKEGVVVVYAPHVHGMHAGK